MCDFHLVCTSGLSSAGTHDIRVSFDQPLMDINQPSEFMDRKGVGFPKEGTVMFFPGLLDQIDKISLNAWLTILSKTDINNQPYY